MIGKEPIAAIAMWKPLISIAATICLSSPVTSAYAQASAQQQDWTQVYTGYPGDMYISNNTARDAKQRNLVRYSILIVLPQPYSEKIQSMVFQFRGWCKPPGANKLVNVSYFDAGGQPVASVDTSVLKPDALALLENLKSDTPGYVLWKSACEISNR